MALALHALGAAQRWALHARALLRWALQRGRCMALAAA
jgi:hypothetical protein